MSDNWWDPFVSAASDVGNAVGDAVSTIGDYGSKALDGLSSLGSYAGDAISGLGSTGTNLFAGDSPGNYSNMGGAGLSSWELPDSGVDQMANNYGIGVSNAIGSGMAASGGAGLLSSATDWAKKNPALIETGLKLFGTSQQKNAPPAATTAGYNAAVKGNEARSSVGQSMINQAPFLANNALASAKGAGANASASEAQRLQQQGYKPGDAVYDSAMQTRSIGNQQNEATAYGSGQAQATSQMNTGAGLMAPTNLGSYDSLGNKQDAQQGAENKQNADYAGLAKNAFDIWSNPDKANKAATDQTGFYAPPKDTAKAAPAGT
jgi:hypothetical protein